MAEPPTKILHILPSLDERYGGPLRLVLDLSAAAEGPDLSSEVAGIGPLQLRDNPLPAGAVHMLAGNADAFAYSAGFRPWLRERLRCNHGVVIHGAWTYPGWAAAVEARRAGVPYGYFPHGMLERWAVFGQGFAKRVKKLAYWQWRERAVVERAARVFFTTRTEQERSRALTGPLPQSAILRPYGLLPSTAAAAPVRVGLTLPPDLTVGLFLGRLHPKKNVDFLLRAWSAAAQPDSARLVIAGSGDAAHEAELRALAASLPHTRNVQFAGFVAGADKDYLLGRADWFLLPSRQENFGVAVLEAVGRGSAVAISDQVYLCESFRPESEVLPVDLEAWRRFLTERFADREWREQTRLADLRHLATEYAAPVVISAWRAALRGLACAGGVT